MNTQTITADVVIAGASLSGLAAAITAKEKEPSLDVLVIEKYSGYAAKPTGAEALFSSSSRA